MHSQPPNTAAGEHFADAERLLAALPLVKRRADRDQHVQVALVHATSQLPRAFSERPSPTGRTTRSHPRTKRHPADSKRAERPNHPTDC